MSLAYYEDQLRIIWSEVKRPQTYEYDIIHGNCSCCTSIPRDGNDKGKLNRKREKRYI